MCLINYNVRMSKRSKRNAEWKCKIPESVIHRVDKNSLYIIYIKYMYIKMRNVDSHYFAEDIIPYLFLASS